MHAKGFNGARWLQEEDVSDEVFARRHSVSERGEKMHRMSWGKRPCCRHPKRWVKKIKYTLQKKKRDICLFSIERVTAVFCSALQHIIPEERR